MQHNAFFYVSINISMLQREFYADFSELTAIYFLHYVDHLKFQNYGRHTIIKYMKNRIFLQSFAD